MDYIIKQEVTLRTADMSKDIIEIFCEYHMNENQKKPPTSIVGGSINK